MSDRLRGSGHLRAAGKRISSGSFEGGKHVASSVLTTHARKGPDIDALDDTLNTANPFSLPSGEALFKFRDEEKRRQREERQQEQQKKIWDKTGTNNGPSIVLRAAHSPKKGGEKPEEEAEMSEAAAALAKERRTEKENMSDFISKKREMFLVQMALDTKKEEIRKLEKKARLKEEALKKSEAMLEEDAIRFDAFLKENDRLAHEALTNAEAQSKAKAEKVQEIKKLKHAISILQTEKAKCQEQLDDNEKYREFLERLTPSEWVEEQVQAKHNRQEERRKQRHARKLAKWNAMKEAAEKEQAEIEEEERKKALKEGRMPTKKDVDLNLPPAPDIDDEELTSSGEDLPMYFTQPHQLLDRFGELEENNLFLIRHVQETEEQVEELKQAYEETKRSFDQQTSMLETNISALESKVKEEANLAESTRVKIDQRYAAALFSSCLVPFTRLGVPSFASLDPHMPYLDPPAPAMRCITACCGNSMTGFGTYVPPFAFKWAPPRTPS